MNVNRVDEAQTRLLKENWHRDCLMTKEKQQYSGLKCNNEQENRTCTVKK